MYVSHRCSIKKLCFWGAKNLWEKKLFWEEKRRENIFLSIDFSNNFFFGGNFRFFFSTEGRKIILSFGSLDKSIIIFGWTWKWYFWICVHDRLDYVSICYVWGFSENLWFLGLKISCSILKLRWKIGNFFYVESYQSEYLHTSILYRYIQSTPRTIYFPTKSMNIFIKHFHMKILLNIILHIFVTKNPKFSKLFDL